MSPVLAVASGVLLASLLGLILAILGKEWGWAVLCALGVLGAGVALVCVHAEDRRWR